MNVLEKWILKVIDKNYSLQDGSAFNRAFEEWMKNARFGVNNKEYIGAVYSSIDTWGLYFSKAEFLLYEKTSTGTKELPDHEFLKLFNSPNKWNHWWKYAYNIAGHWGLFGVSYIVAVRDGRGKIVGYDQIPPSLIKPVSSTTLSKGFKFLEGDENERIIPFEDVIFLEYPNPSATEGWGSPIVAKVADQMEVDALQMGYMKKFFKEGGFAGMLFTTDQALNDRTYGRLLEKLRERYQGSENAYKVGLMDAGMKPIKASYSIRDMDIQGSRKLTKEDIYEAFKVSKIHLGATDALNRATAEAVMWQFTSGTIDPVLNYVDDILTSFVRREFDNPRLFVKHNALAPKDVESTMAYYKAMAELGCITINEIREQEGWNKFTFPLADVPIMNVGGSALDLENEVTIGVTPEPEEEPKGEPVEDVEEEEKSYSENMKKLRWKQANSIVAPLERRFNIPIKGYFDSQRRRIMEALKDNYVVEQVFDLQEEDMILYQLLEIEVYSIFQAGYRYGALKYGGSVDLYDRMRFTDTFNKMASNAQIINSTTAKRFNKADVSNYNDAVKAVDGVYKDIYDVRMQALIAPTVWGAYNAGLLQSMVDAGIENKMWLTQRDGRVRQRITGEDHVKMDGMVVPIDEPFLLSNRSGGEDSVMFPGDPNASAENLINERCTILEA